MKKAEFMLSDFLKNLPPEFINTERDSTHLDSQRCNLLISEEVTPMVISFNYSYKLYI